MGNPDISKHGEKSRFKPGKSGNPRGRPPSFIKRAAKEYGVTRADVSGGINSVLFHHSIRDLASMVNRIKGEVKGDKEESRKEAAFMAVCASGVLSDLKRGDMRATSLMLDFMYGKNATEPGADAGGVDAKEYLLFRIQRRLHPAQLRIWHDDARSQILCMPRRWGKSFLIFSLIVRTCLEPDSRCLYVGRSIKEAEKQVSEMRMDWLSQMDMPPGTDLKAMFPPTSWLDVYGLSPGTDGTGIRGRKYKYIFYDEFFHLREDYLQFFEDSIISPMQRDFPDWRELRVGTPPEIPDTLGGQAWEDALAGRNGWKPYTTHDPDENPNISPFEPWFKEKYPNRMATEPFAQREFFARWVYDTEAVMFPDYHVYDPRQRLPAQTTTHVLIGGTSASTIRPPSYAWRGTSRRSRVSSSSRKNSTSPRSRGIPASTSKWTRCAARRGNGR